MCRPQTVSRHDWVLAAVVLVAVAVEVFGRPAAGWWTAALMSLGLVLAGAVLVRRAHPLAAVSLAIGAFLVVDMAALILGAKTVVLYSGMVVLALVYSLCRWAAGRDVVLGMGIVVVVEFIVSTVTDSSGPGDALGGAGVLLFAAALGAAIRYRAMLRDELIAKVKLQEREHLARELHDVVAHHVSAIATQAQVGMILARSCPSSGALESLHTIEHEAVRAMAEMRTMVAALRGRDHEPSYSPGSSVADIERLAVTGSDSPQVDVEFSGDLSDLTSGVQMALGHLGLRDRTAAVSAPTGRSPNSRYAPPGRRTSLAGACSRPDVIGLQDSGPLDE